MTEPNHNSEALTHERSYAAAASNVRPLRSKRGDEYQIEQEAQAAIKPIAGLLAAYERMTIEQQARAGQYFLGYVYDADTSWAAQVIRCVGADDEAQLRTAARLDSPWSQAD